MTLNVLLVGRNGYLSSQLVKSSWANFQLFDPSSISTSSDWNLFEQSLQHQEIILYLHQPSRKDFELNPSDYIETALVSAQKILSRVKILSNAKVIFTGSYWQDLEGKSQRTLNSYAQAKQVVQEYISSSFTSDHRSASLHLFDVYGPDDNRNKLIPTLLRNWKSGITTWIKNPNSTIAPIHISDVIEAIKIEAVERNTPNFHIHSISPNEILSVKEFVQQFLTVFPETKVEFNSHENSDKPLELFTHSHPFGWTPQIDLGIGLQELRKLHS